MQNELGIKVTNYSDCRDTFEKAHEKTKPENLAKALIPDNKTCQGLDVAFNTASPIYCDAVCRAGLEIGYGLDKLAKTNTYKNDVKKKLKELGYSTLQEWADKNPDLVWAPYEELPVIN